MDKPAKRGAAGPESSSPRTSLGYGEHRIPQSYLQFVNSQVGEKSEKFTLLSWPSCISCRYSGGWTLNCHKQFTRTARRASRRGPSRYLLVSGSGSKRCG